MSRPYKPRTVRRLSVDEKGGWLRFLKQADKAARDPLRHGEAFFRASERAGKLPLPPGQNDCAAPLISLIRLGKRFLTLTGVERQEQAGEVDRLARLVRKLFEVEDPRQTREPRRDVFG